MTDSTAQDDEPVGPRPDDDRARRRVRRRRVALLVVLTVVVVVGGLALSLTSPGWLRESPDPAPAPATLGIVLAVVGLVGCVLAGVRARRAGALRLAWNSPTALLGRADRRRLLARIRTHAAVSPADHGRAVALAEQLARQRFLVPAYGGLMVWFVGQSLLASTLLSRWALAVALVLFAVGVPLVLRDSRRARTWLEHHRAADR